jgi:flagellar basal-body rod protein FlgG
MINQIIQVAAQNGMQQFQVLEQVTRNVANFNTNGYKTQRFDLYLMPDGPVQGTTRVDTTQGPLLVTKRDTDVAIEGEGYFTVTQPDGSIAYTRDGSFTRNSEGFLITNTGDLVGKGIQIPVKYELLEMMKDGTIQIREKNQIKPKIIGKLELVNFRNPEGLKPIGQNKLLPTDQSGPPLAIAETTGIRQGMVERSNVNMFFQVDQILRLNASVISNLRVIKFSDELYRQSVNLKQ